MHPMSCTCPSCQAARAGEFEFEYESFEGGETSEQEELELAMELLSVQNEHEMEQFLGTERRFDLRGGVEVRPLSGWATDGGRFEKGRDALDSHGGVFAQKFQGAFKVSLAITEVAAQRDVSLDHGKDWEG